MRELISLFRELIGKRKLVTELAKAEPKRQFTIGIVDDVTNLSLPEDKNCPNTAAEGTIECKFWDRDLCVHLR